MGYFNYFIKCIIRKFLNIFFRPKSMLIILIIIFFLYLFGGTARAEWTDTEIEETLTRLLQITEKMNSQIYYLESIDTDATEIINKLGYVNTRLSIVSEYLSQIHVNTVNIKTELSSITSQIDSLNTEILNIYNQLEENQKELLTELEEDNKAVLEELNMIRDAINGTEEQQDTFVNNGFINCGDTTSALYRLKSISLNYENKYTYTIKIYYKQGSSYSYNARVYATDNIIPQGYFSSDYWSNFKSMGNVPSGTSTISFTYIVPSTNPEYIYFSAANYIEKIEVYRSIKGIVESLNDSNSLQQEQNQIQQENNQLQQQQNQLQQEQNDFLSKPSDDSDVSVDSFNNVDSNDITSAGLSGVFNTIYNSITSWKSKDIVLPIPKVNKSITISANYTENMMSRVGGGGLVNIIHTVYYFIVARFIIYSITGIINSIKSGSILETDTKNNITTDML